MYKFAKRVLDIVVCLAVSPVALPLILFGLCGSAIAHRSNPLFLQTRTGLGGEPFWIAKIKTMREPVEGRDNSDDARLTAFGEMIRKCSIDELPQIYNIFKGDMSLVGPRPQMHSYLEIMPESAMPRYQVKPGLSGWSQVNGRNSVTWQERFDQDLWYVDNASFLLDLYILYRTAVVVFSCRGVSSESAVTMRPLCDEMAQAAAERSAARAPSLPPVLASIVEKSVGSVVSFSLHDPDHMNIATIDPADVFVLYGNWKCNTFDNVHFDVWRRPDGSDTSFLLCTVGPFRVDLDAGERANIVERQQTRVVDVPSHKRQLKAISG